jgi:hypothetical protein
MGRVFAVLMLSATAALAGHPDPDDNRDAAKPRPAKTTLGVGVTLDQQGRLWLAKVEDQRLLVS